MQFGLKLSINLELPLFITFRGIKIYMDRKMVMLYFPIEAKSAHVRHLEAPYLTFEMQFAYARSIRGRLFSLWIKN
ncbi:hypothetical protein D1B33_02380 [Lysinibacillus yapensis]|uniref:Uncharacterized protein n=1 Tax=Ureibacillus yapensis TaxID=2304605 RepID=A0A396SL15_9BACL|nr:hypothetical protein D1B33_02380 [Lysinibacillus yapensis]